ncbi:hypothetical protein ACLB2K_039381 [Fragaria x ananassa]
MKKIRIPVLAVVLCSSSSFFRLSRNQEADQRIWFGFALKYLIKSENKILIQMRLLKAMERQRSPNCRIYWVHLHHTFVKSDVSLGATYEGDNRHLVCLR